MLALVRLWKPGRAAWLVLVCVLLVSLGAGVSVGFGRCFLGGIFFSLQASLLEGARWRVVRPLVLSLAVGVLRLAVVAWPQEFCLLG